MAQGRMKKKVLAAREALAGGVTQVILADSRAGADPHGAGRWWHLDWSGGRLIAGLPTMNQTSSPSNAAHTSGVYPKRPLAIVRGKGARLWDADGNEYIDCVGGQGAANLGHAHPGNRVGHQPTGRPTHYLP